MAPRETENNAYAKSWGDKQRALWYIMIFSGVVKLRNGKRAACNHGVMDARRRLLSKKEA